VTLYPDGTLGTHDEIFHAVQEGSVEIGIFSPYVNLVPGGMLNWVPWTIETYDQSAVAFNSPDGILYQVMTDAWEEVGCHFLFVGLEGPYGIGNNVRPIKTPDDFKNLTLRVSSSLGFVRALENMGKGTGMTVATIPWADLYNALERKVVDGCWSLWSSMVEERHFEVIKYYTGLDWAWGTNNIVINNELWSSLTPELQEAIFKAGEVAEIREYEVHRRADADFKKIITEGGTEIYYPTAEERELFREKANMPAVWEELCKPWLEEHYPEQNMTQKVQEELERIHNYY
jgi:C4-dicarboxylate-binding protein DctP